MQYLYGWLRYDDIISTCALLKNNSEQATSVSSLLFVSSALKMSSDGNFELIARWFLDSYSFPDSLITTIKSIIKAEMFDCDNMSFHEEISYSFFGKDPMKTINEIPKKYAVLREPLRTQIKGIDRNMNPIMVIYGANYYLDILYPILQFIMDTVAHIYKIIKSFQKTGASFFLRQTAPSKFLSQFEIKVVDSIFDKSFYTLDTKSIDISGMYPADVKGATPFPELGDDEKIVQSLAQPFVEGRMQIIPKPNPVTPAAVDGFVSVTEPSVGDNIDHVINTVSNYSNSNLALFRWFPKSVSRDALVDKYWGYAYNESLLQYDYSIYGNENVPVNFADKAFGYLRVPFRKIPRIDLASADELMVIVEEVTSKYQFGRKILFRGQANEYYLGRDKTALKRLYNDENAHELSLMPSSARSKESFEDIYPAWSFLISHFKSKMNIPNPESLDYMRFMYNLSLAQHYGLPSCGLDLTDDIGAALFFALNQYISGSPSKYKRKEAGKSVIYILECDNQDVMSYSVFDNKNEISRPKAQSAYFFHTGWGLASNRAARQVRAAIYFDASFEFKQEKTANELFPRNDSFINYLQYVKNYCNLPDSIRKWLDRIYYIE